jgi:hypothetical protein
LLFPTKKAQDVRWKVVAWLEETRNSFILGERGAFDTSCPRLFSTDKKGTSEIPPSKFVQAQKLCLV